MSTGRKGEPAFSRVIHEPGSGGLRGPRGIQGSPGDNGPSGAPGRPGSYFTIAQSQSSSSFFLVFGAIDTASNFEFSGAHHS